MRERSARRTARSIVALATRPDATARRSRAYSGPQLMSPPASMAAAAASSMVEV